jgi:hypothetical protein
MKSLFHIASSEKLNADQMQHLTGGGKNSIGLDTNVMSILMKKYATIDKDAAFTVVADGQIYKVSVDADTNIMSFTNKAGKMAKVRY